MTDFWLGLIIERFCATLYLLHRREDFEYVVANHELMGAMADLAFKEELDRMASEVRARGVLN